jgi:hypothetical protein
MSAVTGNDPQPALDTADLVLLNGKIWTGEAARRSPPAKCVTRRVQAVAIRRGRIHAVGSDRRVRRHVGPATQVIDLDGRLALPGFIDSHVHFLQGGLYLLQVELKTCRSESEMAARLAAHARVLGPGRWILGGNWDEQNWTRAALPTRWLIDRATPEHPVFLSRYDGHAALANSLALQLAGITRETPDPAGGLIVRDAASGDPTGLLKDTALDLVRRVLPRLTEAEMEEALRAALAEARRAGVTSVHNVALADHTTGGDFESEIRLLRRAEGEGWLTCRFYEIVPIEAWERLANAGAIRGPAGEFVRLGAVKGFADGSLGSATAWMFEPFEDDLSNRGLPTPQMRPPTIMENLVRQADAAGAQCCLHAIGDRAVREVLELYERVARERASSRRFRVEHAQHVRVEDFPRFARVGTIASMQPYHAAADGRWAEKRLGPRRARTSYAWRSMLRAGVPLAFGSDWPVAPLSPLLGIYAAVTRETLNGKHPQGWIPEERLTVEEAVRAYTFGSAYAEFAEAEKGTLVPGKVADLVVLSQDIFAVPPASIQDARVVLTVTDGRIVYREM